MFNVMTRQIQVEDAVPVTVWYHSHSLAVIQSAETRLTIGDEVLICCTCFLQGRKTL